MTTPTPLEGEIACLETLVDQITAFLKGSGISHLERILAHNDRKDYRARIEQLRVEQ